VRTFDPPWREAIGRTVRGFRRLGKRIVFELEDDLFLVLHLMIAGRLRLRKRGAALSRKGGLAAFDFEHARRACPRSAAPTSSRTPIAAACTPPAARCSRSGPSARAPRWATASQVTAFREGMAVHGRFGRPCPDCATPVQRIAYADNETNYCPECQTGGKLLADRVLSRLVKEDWPRSLEELEERKRAR